MGMFTDKLSFKPQLRVINDDQIDQIHMATLEVLERTGVKITHARALELLAGGGARVDGNRVRFPAWMVEDAIRKAPSRLVLGNRTGERTVFLERDKSYFFLLRDPPTVIADIIGCHRGNRPETYFLLPAAERPT